MAFHMLSVNKSSYSTNCATELTWCARVQLHGCERRLRAPAQGQRQCLVTHTVTHCTSTEVYRDFEPELALLKPPETSTWYLPNSRYLRFVPSHVLRLEKELHGAGATDHKL
ncbi:hypothetical protein HW555_006173 [Spodoptera exigua]|uniref:Uncharacterized protein n=1 Tax=Spodoptera exigua TaxID=7107 RepID=A0A835GGL9_SPOEX|nr:hypothetical protein HW555_006173 [Spodoptera exigua]